MEDSSKIDIDKFYSVHNSERIFARIQVPVYDYVIAWPACGAVGSELELLDELSLESKSRGFNSHPCRLTYRA